MVEKIVVHTRLQNDALLLVRGGEIRGAGGAQPHPPPKFPSGGAEPPPTS